MLPFEHVSASGAGSGVSAGMSGALRPHTRSKQPQYNSPSHQRGGTSPQRAGGLAATAPNPLTSPLKPSALRGSTGAAAGSSGTPTSPSASYHPRRATSPTTSPTAAGSSLLSSAASIANHRQQQQHHHHPGGSSNHHRVIAGVQQHRHADAAFGSPSSQQQQHQHQQRRANTHGEQQQHPDDEVCASDVVPDFQLCVNYKRVDMTVNDAKKHLRVRPPHIKAAIDAVSCQVMQPFEHRNLFGVEAGLDDVGVDHSVLFFVVATDPDCFSVAPTVDCEGTLRFVAAPAAPGSVHLDRTTLFVTAWDALSLTGSSITQHADQVHELEEGVPFCQPIKITVDFIGGQHQLSTSQLQQLAATNSSTASGDNATTPPRAGARARSPTSTAAALDAAHHDIAHLARNTNEPLPGSEAEASCVVRFHRLNPNMLRDPFTVLGAQLQSRLVAGVTSPITDAELACLPLTRQLFFGSNVSIDSIPSAVASSSSSSSSASESASERRHRLADIEQQLRQRVNQASKQQTQSVADADEELSALLEQLGRFGVEHGSSLGDGAAVEVFERVVTRRRITVSRIEQQMQEEQNDDDANSNNNGVDPQRRLAAILGLLRAYNCLAAAEVAIGNLSDAEHTLTNAMRLNVAYEREIDDADAAWVMLRQCYVLLARGDAEGALRLLRSPAIAEIDNVFTDHVGLRVLFHILGAVARCALGRYGEAIRRMRQVIANEERTNAARIDSARGGGGGGAGAAGSDDEAHELPPPLPLGLLRQTLALACIRVGDITQARSLLQQLDNDDDDATEENEQEQDQHQNETQRANTTSRTTRALTRGVTCILRNMAHVYSPLPHDVVRMVDDLQSEAQLAVVSTGGGAAAAPSCLIFRQPATLLRIADAWQALMLDPHTTTARAFLNTMTGSADSSNTAANHAGGGAASSSSAPSPSSSSSLLSSSDLFRVKLFVLDAAVSVATTAGAVSGAVERQRRAVEQALGRLQRELHPHHRDVISCAEVLAWLELCVGNGQSALVIADRAQRSLAEHGVDVLEQVPRLSQLIGQACGVLNFEMPAAALTATAENLEEFVLRYGDGTRALFTPLVDRAMAEINSNLFAAALDKLHKALKIVDSGNAIFLLGPLFRPAAQLSPEELAERSRLSKDRVDARAANDFAVVLFAMATVAEAEGRLFDAETLLLQVLAALELAGIDDGFCTAAVYRAMAQLLFEDGHFGDALAYVERAERLLHNKFPFAQRLKEETLATQGYIQFQLRTCGYSLKRVPDTRFRFAVFV